MNDDPEFSKKLEKVTDRQNRWIGRRIEDHDAKHPSTHPTVQAFEASAPEASEQPVENNKKGPMAVALPMAMVSAHAHEAPDAEDNELERLPVGLAMSPSGQGGEEQQEGTGCNSGDPGGVSSDQFIGRAE